MEKEVQNQAEAFLDAFFSTPSATRRATGGSTLLAGLYLLKKYSDAQLVERVPGKAKGENKPKAAVDKKFFLNLKKFLPILVPGVASKEVANLLAVGFILLARTWLDFWLIANNAEILGKVAQRDSHGFAIAVGKFGLMQLPLSVVNGSLKFLIAKLAANFRERLTIHMHRKYMNGLTFYAVTNLDNRIKNVDQLLCQDIENFSVSLSNLYSNLTKPIVDVVMYFSKLVQNFGWTGPTSMLTYFLLAGAIMTNLRTPFGAYTALAGKLEGDFRHVHSRIITHSEEVAFYGGAAREHNLINDTFRKLLDHTHRYENFKFFLGIFDSMITKYSATTLAYFLVTAPIFDPKNDARYVEAKGGSPRAILEDYTKYMRLLIGMVTAVGRLVGAGRELSHFAGHNDRIALLNTVLNDLGKGEFKRTQVSDSEVSLEKKGKVTLDESDQPIIKFEHVPIITPNGDLLVKDLSFEVRSGMNCLISGPNGSGKSSLFRILGGLWSLYDGSVTRPAQSNLFYVPQRPYLAIGTLRDQVIYPDTEAEMKAKGFSDEDILNLMKVVKLEHIVEREGGWSATSDWQDVLSGGEKQRTAMARLFYHHPKFAILDECTSAVSVDVEADMYNYCRQVGITLFTVSHRTSLWKFHEWHLTFDGRGSYTFEKMVVPEEK